MQKLKEKGKEKTRFIEVPQSSSLWVHPLIVEEKVSSTDFHYNVENIYKSQLQRFLQFTNPKVSSTDFHYNVENVCKSQLQRFLQFTNPRDPKSTTLSNHSKASNLQTP